ERHEEADEGVLRRAALEVVEPVDEDVVLRPEAVAEERPRIGLVDPGAPGVETTAAAEERPLLGRPVRAAGRAADVVLESPEALRVVRVVRRGIRGGGLVRLGVARRERAPGAGDADAECGLGGRGGGGGRAGAA